MFKIIRNDITKMTCDAIVNTANEAPVIGDGCDRAIYEAAGKEELLAERKKIGFLAEGEAAITPAFSLPARYIIHAVSPLYVEDDEAVEARLRSCYRNSLRLAVEHEISSVAFPLIATGSYGYPREEALRIAVDEIHAFLLKHDLDVFLVVFDGNTTELVRKITEDLTSYIDRHYVEEKVEEEYRQSPDLLRRELAASGASSDVLRREPASLSAPADAFGMMCSASDTDDSAEKSVAVEMFFDEEKHGSAIAERMKHLSDTFSQYLLYLIGSKGLKNSEVYHNALVDKKAFSKIKNNPDYHPKKMTAMCLCIGARLNMDEARDLLARAGYALSPADKTDVIFSFFIENGIYDIYELDIQLEEHGEKCLIP